MYSYYIDSAVLASNWESNMSKFTVYNTRSGQELGVYEAETAEAAIEANYIDAGYAGSADYAASTGDTSNDLAASAA